MSDWSEIDNKMLDPHWYLTDEYRDVYARLRVEDPVHWTQDSFYGKDYWFITRYDDVREYLLDHRTFSSRWETRVPKSPKRYTPEERYEMGFDTSLARSDPPVHDLYRRPMNKHFSTPAIAKLLPNVERVVDEILDDIAEDGECDLVEQVAGLLPVRVVLGMLGVPEQDWDELREAAWQWFAPADPKFIVDNDPVKTTRIGHNRILDYCERLALDRRKNPKEDLATIIAGMTIDGDELSIHEIRSYLTIVVGGGLETTRNTGAAGLYLFMTNPDQQRLLSDDPSLAKEAVEEVVRYITPTRARFRVATDDVEFHGRQIRRGDWVIGSLASANRDETKFEDADSFDITRAPVPHLGFSEGVHLCLGRALARLELQTLYRKVLHAFPDMQPSADPTPIADISVTGYTEMPVTFTPRARSNAR